MSVVRFGASDQVRWSRKVRHRSHDRFSAGRGESRHPYTEEGVFIDAIVTRLTYPDGWAADFAYDALNRVTAANDNNGAPRTLASVSYDALSRRQSVTYANGTSAQYGYTARGDLTCHDWNLTGAAPSACNVAGAEIAYDFTYNGVGQLVAKALNDPLLKWSPPGNSSDAYVVNGLNQYADINGIAPVHDGNGNITTDHRGRTYIYDAENVLRAANENGGAALGAYAYYADGARRSKTAGGATGTFYYTGDQEIAEYAGATLTRRYVRLPGSIDEPFLMIDYSSGAGVESWAHQNRLGSVVAISDSTGVVAANNKFTYSPYGESGPEGDGGFPFRFTGQKLDAETGLYYYKARYYDPETGRFLQTDPIGYADQMNLYGYVGNDPVNNSDPTGEMTYNNKSDCEADLGEGKCSQKTTRNERGNLIIFWSEDPNAGSLQCRSSSCRRNVQRASTVAKVSLLGRSLFSGRTATLSTTQGRLAVSGRQLQKKFKHAGDFGVRGNFNPANAEKFALALQRSVNGSRQITGAGGRSLYRRNGARIFYNERTRNVVVTSRNNEFVTGYRIGRRQLERFLKSGNLN